jgi:hypothetical protein
MKGFDLAGPIHTYLANDHNRLDESLHRAGAGQNRIDSEAYAEFRAGLLRHISIEEKILIPAAQRLRGGTPLPIVAKIRLDHGALVALMVPPPTVSLISTLRSILTVHNKLEEEVEGLYEASEHAIGADAGVLLELIRKAADVRILPHNPDPKALEAARRAVERAGYAMD